MDTALMPKEAFRRAYMIELGKAHARAPGAYAWLIEELPTVADKMVAALERRAAQLGSSVKRAAKTCRVRNPNMTNIAAFLAAPDWQTTIVAGLVS